MARVTIRIDFESGQALGPGKIRLLEQVDETGSIRGAASSMKMSYRRAWLLLQATEAIFGAPLAQKETGGPRGGGARLTALGRKVIGHYRKAERLGGGAAAASIGALSKMSVSLNKAPKVKKPRKRQ
jgi:molybdate transport system regulatory protein